MFVPRSHTRPQTVQRSIIVGTLAIPEGQAKPGNDIVRTMLVRHHHDLGDIRDRVLDKGEDRHHTDPDLDPAGCQCLQSAKTTRRRRRAGFKTRGEIVVGGRDGKGDRSPSLGDIHQGIDVLENHVTLGHQMERVAALGNDCEGLAREIVDPLRRRVGIAHGTGPDEPLRTLPEKFLAKALHSVDFDQYVARILDTIALAARIAIDAAVLASTVDIHIILDPKPGIWMRLVRQERLGPDLTDHPRLPLFMSRGHRRQAESTFRLCP